MYEIGYLIYLDKMYDYYKDKDYYLSQDFINLIRDSGGFNTKRLLIIPMLSSYYELSLINFEYAKYKIPKDPNNKLAISIYYYFPCEDNNEQNILESINLYDTYGYSEIVYPHMEWGSSQNYKNIFNNFNYMKQKFTDKGFPIIIGEVGTLMIILKKIILLNNFYMFYSQCPMNMKVFCLVYGISPLILQFIKTFITIKKAANGLMINFKKFLIKFLTENLLNHLTIILKQI